jgi:hypothetical protein
MTDLNQPFDYDAIRHDAHGCEVPPEWQSAGDASPLVQRAQDLSLRRTRGYVGTWQHLDEWESIGSYITVSWGSWYTDPDDMCEPISTISRIWVNTRDNPASIEDIEQALRDSLSSNGCSHDYDCCGCRSYYVSRCDYEPALNEWLVTVSSSRNY